MRLIDADALIQPLKLQMESYDRIGASERAESYRNVLLEISEAPTIDAKRKRESRAMLPCICGSKRREHWFSGSDKFPEELRCAKCGFSVKGRDATDVIRVWNMVIESELDMKAASGVGQAFSPD